MPSPTKGSQCASERSHVRALDTQVQFGYCSGAQVALLCSAAPFQSNIVRQHHGQWCGWRLSEQGLTLVHARFYTDKHTR